MERTHRPHVELQKGLGLSLSKRAKESVVGADLVYSREQAMRHLVERQEHESEVYLTKVHSKEDERDKDVLLQNAAHKAHIAELWYLSRV